MDFPIICPTIVGRATELAMLSSLVQYTEAGTGQVLLLCGEAGIGKSRLVKHVKAETQGRGFITIQGNCFQADISCPYAPIIDLFNMNITNHCPFDKEDLQIYAHELYPLLHNQVIPRSNFVPLALPNPEQEKRRLFASLSHFFLQIASQQPVLLIIEDLHWSDDTSLEFFHYLARHCASAPISLILTYRSDELQPGLQHWLGQMNRERLVHEHTLARLTYNDVDAMLQAIFSVRLSIFEVRRFVHGDLLDTIYTLTEGNPFFVEEILTDLVSSGTIVFVDNHWKFCQQPGDLIAHSPIPRSVQDVVQGRIAKLSDSARQIVFLAAVAGRRFNFNLLKQITGSNEQDLLKVIKELIAAQLVVEESEVKFAFRHMLLRQAIYTELLERERVLLHSNIAETLEQMNTSNNQEVRLADLAYHCYEARIWTKAAEYGQLAGEKALQLYTPRAAIEQFNHALEATHNLHIAPSPQLYAARGQAHEILGEFDSARLDYEFALHQATRIGDRKAAWQALTNLGFIWAGRDYSQAESFYRQALELAREIGNSTLIAHSLNRMGNWHLNTDHVEEALLHHREALDIFHLVNDRHGVAQTLDFLGNAHYKKGDLLQCKDYYQQAIALFQEVNDRLGWISSQSVLLSTAGDYVTTTAVSGFITIEEALQLGEQGLKMTQEIGQRSAEAYILLAMGACLGPRGEFTRAYELIHRGREIAEEIEHRQWTIAGHWALGMLYLDLLAFSKAFKHLEIAFAIARKMRSDLWLRLVGSSLALARLRTQDIIRATALLDTIFKTEVPMSTLMQRTAWAVRAEQALILRDPQQALQIIERLIANTSHISAEQQVPYLLKLRAEALAQQGATSEAEKTFLHAHSSAQRYGLRPLLWHIDLSLGNFYLARGWRREAVHMFHTSRAVIEELTASIANTHLQTQFHQNALKMFPRSASAPAHCSAKQEFGGLTMREREVATLIAQGLSNREIAERLIVSYRTVETHVGAILAKLAFTSRSQIAIWAIEIALVKQRS